MQLIKWTPQLQSLKSFAVVTLVILWFFEDCVRIQAVVEIISAYDIESGDF
jgi:hypothetical protein